MNTPSDAEVVKWLDARCEHGWECHKARGTWRGGTLVGSMLTMGAICDSPSAARLSLAKALGMGKVAECPLPEDWREWDCKRDASAPGEMVRGEWQDWVFCVMREPILAKGNHWTFKVYCQGYLVHFAPCGGIESGRRAAVKAARRAWKVLNG